LYSTKAIISILNIILYKNVHLYKHMRMLCIIVLSHIKCYNSQKVNKLYKSEKTI